MKKNTINTPLIHINISGNVHTLLCLAQLQITATNKRD